jgi:hypothetical protein
MARILRKLEIQEISAVDKPAQRHARAVIMKRHTEYTPDELVALIKKSVVAGETDNEPKYKYMEALTMRANDLRVAGDTDAQAFTKAILNDEPCKLMYKLMKSAPGSEVPPQPVVTTPKPEHAGPAHAKLHSMTVDLQRAQPRLSYEGAYARVYTAPENAALRDSVRKEHLAASLAGLSG